MNRLSWVQPWELQTNELWIIKTVFMNVHEMYNECNIYAKMFSFMGYPQSIKLDHALPTFIKLQSFCNFILYNIWDYLICIFSLWITSLGIMFSMSIQAATNCTFLSLWTHNISFCICTLASLLSHLLMELDFFFYQILATITNITAKTIMVQLYFLHCDFRRLL